MLLEYLLKYRYYPYIVLRHNYHTEELKPFKFFFLYIYFFSNPKRLRDRKSENIKKYFQNPIKDYIDFHIVIVVLHHLAH